MAEIQITVTGDGRDAKGRRIAHCLCPACGQPFSARWDHVKSGKTKRCPTCRGNAPRVDAQATPIAAPAIPAPPITEPALSEPEERNAEWYRAAIAEQKAGLARAEKDVKDYGLLVSVEGIQPAGMDGKSKAALYREAVSTATVFRKEIKRLEARLYELEGQKQQTITPLQSVAMRAAAIRGQKR